MGVGGQATEEPESTKEADPEPTRRGLLGRIGGQEGATNRPADGAAKLEFASVSAGDEHTCGVLRDGSVRCWGRDDYGQATPPEGVFASVSAGGRHTCGVLRDGSVLCWGDDDDGRATPPEGEFASVSAGVSHTCGVLRDGSVRCWGKDWSGQATPPEGEFASVSAGGQPHLRSAAGRLRQVLGR